MPSSQTVRRVTAAGRKKHAAKMARLRTKQVHLFRQLAEPSTQAKQARLFRQLADNLEELDCACPEGCCLPGIITTGVPCLVFLKGDGTADIVEAEAVEKTVKFGPNGIRLVN